MPIPREKIERRALKAGIRASKRRHHVVSLEELLALKIQIVPASVRIFAVLAGAGLIAGAWFEWPSARNLVCGLEAVAGIFTALFGIFGVRRTLSGLLDGAGEVVVEILGEIAGALFDSF